MTPSIDAAVIVMTKEPRPGRSKTRLCPPLSPIEAAEVAEAALRDTLDAVEATRCARRVVALDGEAGDWCPPGFEVIPQRGDGLDERLANAFADVGAPAIIIAMDTPQVTAALLDHALGCLSVCDAALGPTADGGYWTIGLRDPHLDVIRGVPMSRSDTWSEQSRRLDAAGLRWDRLECLVDVDDIDDAATVSALIPESRFGRLVRSLVED